DLVFELANLLARPRGRPSTWDAEIGAILTTLNRWAPVASVFAGPVYGFGPALPEHEYVVLEKNDARLLQAELPEWVEALTDGAPMAAVLSGGRAVSVCASVRRSPAIHCAGVQTSLHHRGQGYAARAVSGWATLVRKAGAQ